MEGNGRTGMSDFWEPPGLLGALGLKAPTIRIGFWGPFWYNYNKEPPK